MNANTIAVERADLLRIASAVNVAILAADKAADHSAEGKDVEGEIADVRVLLEDVADKLGRAVG